MAGKTSIEWTEKTWNPVTGCTKVSAGCDNCYAERITRRFGGDFTKVILHPERLDAPVRWKNPTTVFVNSMSDLFHSGAVPFDYVDRVFDVMEKCPQHTFQILTKRPSRMKHFPREWPRNVWAGTSVESTETAWRIDQLRQVDSHVRFLSLEPLLGALPNLDLNGIGWVIVGGESGPGHREIREEWVLEIKSQCIDAGVPFFFKQWGGIRPKTGGRELAGRLWSQMPRSPQLAAV
ncbi:MAG: phage Gp37/Gp68 family protein [Chloroflexi bacterium]|nr:phage Gp37/Gp68 family protein [Chloroflexota bacterium]